MWNFEHRCASGVGAPPLNTQLPIGGWTCGVLGTMSERWMKILWKWVVIEWILCWVDLFRKLLCKTEIHILPLQHSCCYPVFPSWERSPRYILFFWCKSWSFTKITRCQDERTYFWRGWCWKTVSTAQNNQSNSQQSSVMNSNVTPFTNSYGWRVWKRLLQCGIYIVLAQCRL